MKTNIVRAITLAFGLCLICIVPTIAEDASVTAIDVVLRPDSVMLKHAREANAELLKDYPKGFALDATHNPHITLLQRYVKTSDLEKVYDTVAQVASKESPKRWKLKAFKYYYGKGDNSGLAGIVVEPTPDLRRIQKEMIDAVAPYSVPTGSASAFVTTPEEPTINKFTMDFVSGYVEKAAGDKFNPHVTVGLGSIPYLDKLLAQPFRSFSFSPAGVSVYQLGDNGAARKELKAF